MKTILAFCTVLAVCTGCTTQWRNMPGANYRDFSVKDGLLYGQGTFKWRDGSTYIGEVKANKPNGSGTNTEPAGLTYVSEWKDGKPIGPGAVLLPDGTKMAGKWTDGWNRGPEESTAGTGTNYTGAVYVGQWKDGQPHGQGTLNKTNGMIMSGSWLNGNYIGREAIAQTRAPDGKPDNPDRKAGEAISIEFGGGIRLEMVWIPPGQFMMGSPTNEFGRRGKGGAANYIADDEGQHSVTITKGFWIGKFEVTCPQWNTVFLNKADIIPVKDGPHMPIKYVFWNGCQEFIARLNRIVPGGGFRLPTEAEWEYACRAGTTTALNNGKDLTEQTTRTGKPLDVNRVGPFKVAKYSGACSNLDEIAWYFNNSDGTVHPVGQKKPNAWGIHDMLGNLLEICQDPYGMYPSCPVVDPLGPATPARQVGVVMRGGSFNHPNWDCRSAYRVPAPYSDSVAIVAFNYGIRIVRSLP